MSKEKMKFPPVPGDTPREQFMNLARLLITMPKSTLADEPGQRKRRRRKKAKTLGILLLCCLLSGLSQNVWAEPYLRANTLVCATPQGILVHYDCPKLRALARKFQAPNLAQQEDCPAMEEYICIRTWARMNIQVIGEPAPYVTISDGTSNPMKIAEIRLFTDAAGHTFAVGGSVNPYVKASDLH